MNKENEGNVRKLSVRNELAEPTASYSTVAPIGPANDELYDKVMNYWQELTIEKKKVILDLMRVLVEDERPVQIPKEKWEIIMKERDDYSNDVGKTYSWDQVREMMHDKTKRDDLRN